MRKQLHEFGVYVLVDGDEETGWQLVSETDDAHLAQRTAQRLMRSKLPVRRAIIRLKNEVSQERKEAA